MAADFELVDEAPDAIEQRLVNGKATVAAFSRRGNLLAAGRSDGSVVIWDFETRGVWCTLRREEGAPVSAITWSRNTRKLLTGSSKGELVLWDVLSGAAEHTRAMGHAVTSVSLHPRTPTLALVSLADAEPQLLDLAKARAATVAWEPDGPQPLLGERCVAAMFAHSGERIFACTSKGTVCAYAIRDGELKREAGLTSLASTKVRASSLTLSPRRALPRHVVAFDRSLRLFDAETLQPRRELSDVVNRVVWRQAQFSPHGELVYGAVASSTQHKIFVWRRADGRLERTLDEPRDGMSDLVAHPLRPVLVSVGRSGVLYVWGKRYAENWSAFAADFRLLEENQEYEEREDEFDLVPEQGAREAHGAEEAEVDVWSVEPRADKLSEVEDELVFPPVVPVPDPPTRKQLIEKALSRLANAEAKQAAVPPPAASSSSSSHVPAPAAAPAAPAAAASPKRPAPDGSPEGEGDAQRPRVA